MDPLEFKDIIVLVAIAVVAILLIMGLGYIKNNTGSKKLLHRKYFLQLLQLGVMAYAILRIVRVFNPTLNFHSILLTGSAIIVAIIGFAAQTAISDVICGLLISVNKPFEIGDRIIIDGLEPGVVEDITLRHIVIAIYDDFKIIVPNSQLNTKTLINTSFHNSERRGIHLRYSVSYDTDVVRAMDIIRDCVAESPYTLGVVRNGVTEDSGPVYFLEFGESALILETTIWVTRQTSSYVASTDVNVRVNNAFKANGIEIPYNYVNVIEVEAKNSEESVKTGGSHRKTAPSKRHYRTANIRLKGGEEDMQNVKDLAKAYSQRQRLTQKDARQLELLTEETIILIDSMVGDVKTNMWIEGTGVVFRIHSSFDAQIGSEEYKKLMGLSTSGRNEALSGLGGRIFDAMMRGIASDDKNDENHSYQWEINKKDMSQDEMCESILGAISNDIKVSVAREKVELVIEKNCT